VFDFSGCSINQPCSPRSLAVRTAANQHPTLGFRPASAFTRALKKLPPKRASPRLASRSDVTIWGNPTAPFRQVPVKHPGAKKPALADVSRIFSP
jgi:hypothetical protein